MQGKKKKKIKSLFLQKVKGLLLNIANRLGYLLTLKCLSQAAAESIYFKSIHAKLFQCCISSLLNFVFFSSNFPAQWKNWIPAESAWMYLSWIDIFQPMIPTSAHMLEQWAACTHLFNEKNPRCLLTALSGKGVGFLLETLKPFMCSGKGFCPL